MITVGELEGRKCTAKQMAAHIVCDAMASSFYWAERLEDQKLTERERGEVSRHVESLVRRFVAQCQPILPDDSGYKRK